MAARVRYSRNASDTRQMAIRVRYLSERVRWLPAERVRWLPVRYSGNGDVVGSAMITKLNVVV